MAQTANSPITPTVFDSNQPTTDSAKKSKFLTSIGNHKIAMLAVVFAILFAGIGTYILASSNAATAPAPTAIAAPTNLRLNAVSTTSAAITWFHAKTGGITYNILRNGVVVGSTNDNYNTNYLDTGLKPGTTYYYRITAQKGTNVSPRSTAIKAITGSANTAITSCGKTISTSGNYVLTTNLNFVGGGKGSTPACVNFANVSNVSLDCQNHTISQSSGGLSLVDISNVSKFMIINCKFINAQLSVNHSTVSISSATDGTIEKNTSGASSNLHKNTTLFSVSASDRLVIKNNSFISSYYNQSATKNTYIGHNNFTWDSQTISPGSITSGNGSSNVIYGNSIDGGSGTDGRQIGTDDGVVLGGNAPSIIAQESKDAVLYNNIKNVWDAGIEGVGAITGNNISYNTISNAYVAGISSYHYTSWTNNTISFNKQNTTSSLTLLLYFYEQEPIPAGTQVYFQNNRIISNTFTPTTGNMANGVSIDFPSTAYTLGNNIFQNNNLSHLPTMYAPYFNPASLVVDGGGNTCVTRRLPAFTGPIGIACK